LDELIRQTLLETEIQKEKGKLEKEKEGIVYETVY